jgi:hypothetical protein
MTKDTCSTEIRAWRHAISGSGVLKAVGFMPIGREALFLRSWRVIVPERLPTDGALPSRLPPESAKER